MIVRQRIRLHLIGQVFCSNKAPSTAANEMCLLHHSFLSVKDWLNNFLVSPFVLKYDEKFCITPKIMYFCTLVG
jgi:hypothetical protein